MEFLIKYSFKMPVFPFLVLTFFTRKDYNYSFVFFPLISTKNYLIFPLITHAQQAMLKEKQKN
jgi:hypothetical protein